MATTLVAGTAARADASAGYARFAGVCAVLAGIGTLVYSISFILLANEAVSSLALLANGLLATAVAVGIYERVKSQEPSFALWALLLSLLGGIGAALHGGYDLAALLHSHSPVDPNLPSAMDPRGLLTFGASGIGLWVFAWLILRSKSLPTPVGYLGYLVAALQIVLYLGRLIVFDAANPVIVVPALLAGFIATPIWYVWLGVSLWRGARA
ncbi:MAG: hypothetical protein JO020_32805 [Chloroflexi bacterium]|nr:hypothetical protein [Chloroflexota bacterium]MBV9898962.1 hypothetical protein [Chloroflexota bacterium]